MKNLIRTLSYGICILLLTCTFCLAQNSSGVASFADLIDTPIDTTNKRSAGKGMIELFKEYEQHCYNDSASIDFGDCWIIQSPDSLYLASKMQDYAGFDTVYVKYDGYENYQLFVNELYWRHKSPNFEDFVRWVAKKYGL